MKTQYTLEILRGKSYRRMYTGKQSQCFKRLDSVFSRARIKNAATGQVLTTIPAR